MQNPKTTVARSRLTNPETSRAKTAHSSEDRGLAAIWVAMLLTLLMAFAAMAVDLGLWYVERSEAQNATDAAALAGAAMLPTDPVLAVEEAQRVAGQHGYDASEITAVVVGRGQLQVRIETEVDNFFLPSFGLSDTTLIGTQALAEYEGSVTMGSPNNVLGNDPEASPGYVQPEIVLGVAAPQHRKQDGDRYSTKRCLWNSDSSNPSVSNCDSKSGPNHEFDPEGYFFSVTVEATHSEDLVISAYDFGFAYNGGTSCGYGMTSTEENNLENLTDTGSYSSGGDSIPQGYYDDADDRYDSGKGIWCTGDLLPYWSSPMMKSTFIVRAPDATPWNALDNPVLGIDQPSVDCEPVTIHGRILDNRNDTDTRPSAYQLLNPNDTRFNGGGQWAVDVTDDDWTFAETFRRWAPLCRIPASQVETGEYIIQIRTSAQEASPLVYDPHIVDEGVDMFMLRAGFDDGTSTPAAHGGDVTLAARGRLPIFANSDVSDPSFYLARILPVSQSRTLTIELFDAGDAGSPGTIQVSPPDDANISDFSGCTFLLDGSGSVSGDTSICKLTNVGRYTGYQGKTVLIDVPIPSNYDCDELDPEGCWVKLDLSYPADVTDFTTWGAYVSGDPVRLIE